MRSCRWRSPMSRRREVRSRRPRRTSRAPEQRLAESGAVCDGQRERLEVERLRVDFRAVDFLALERFFGTLAPFARASDSPIAIAYLRLVPSAWQPLLPLTRR